VAVIAGRIVERWMQDAEALMQARK
jgi:hypothetical protein